MGDVEFKCNPTFTDPQRSLWKLCSGCGWSGCHASGTWGVGHGCLHEAALAVEVVACMGHQQLLSEGGSHKGWGGLGGFLASKSLQKGKSHTGNVRDPG